MNYIKKIIGISVLICISLAVFMFSCPMMSASSSDVSSISTLTTDTTPPPCHGCLYSSILCLQNKASSQNTVFLNSHTTKSSLAIVPDTYLSQTLLIADGFLSPPYQYDDFIPNLNKHITQKLE